MNSDVNGEASHGIVVHCGQCSLLTELSVNNEFHAMFGMIDILYLVSSFLEL